MNDLSAGTKFLIWRMSLAIAAGILALFHVTGFDPLRDFVNLARQVVDTHTAS